MFWKERVTANGRQKLLKTEAVIEALANHFKNYDWSRNEPITLSSLLSLCTRNGIAIDQHELIETLADYDVHFSEPLFVSGIHERSISKPKSLEELKWLVDMQFLVKEHIEQVSPNSKSFNFDDRFEERKPPKSAIELSIMKAISEGMTGHNWETNTAIFIFDLRKLCLKASILITSDQLMNHLASYGITFSSSQSQERCPTDGQASLDKLKEYCDMYSRSKNPGNDRSF